MAVGAVITGAFCLYSCYRPLMYALSVANGTNQSYYPPFFAGATPLDHTQPCGVYTLQSVFVYKD